jgi:hypothetical protein
MSSGIRAGLEVRGTESMPPATWLAVALSVAVDEVPNRALFALLAGYPSPLGIDPVVSLRGLPRDLTRRLQELYDEWGDAAFDASWVSFEELRATAQRLTKAIEELAQKKSIAVDDFVRLQRGVSIDAVIAFLGVYDARGFDTRMVFWSTPI